jgi:hypothetical protein
MAITSATERAPAVASEAARWGQTRNWMPLRSASLFLLDVAAAVMALFVLKPMPVKITAKS